MFRFFTVIVTFRPQGMPHNHIKNFLFPWIMLDTIKILLFLPFQKKTITLPPCVVLHSSFCPQSSPTLNILAIPHGSKPGCLGTATPRRHLSAITTPRKSECCHRVYQHSSFFSKYYSEI